MKNKADRLWLERQCLILINEITSLSNKDLIPVEDLKKIINYEDAIANFLIIWIRNIEKYIKILITNFYNTRGEWQQKKINDIIKTQILNFEREDYIMSLAKEHKKRLRYEYLFALPIEGKIHNTSLSKLRNIFLKDHERTKFAKDFYTF